MTGRDGKLVPYSASSHDPELTSRISHRGKPRLLGRAPGTPANPRPRGFDLRPQPFPARVLRRLERRRIRGYQIRARVGDTRITYG
jgi:hypothetical protein